MVYQLASLTARFPTLGVAVEQSQNDLGSTGALYPNRHGVIATIGDEEQSWDAVAYAALVGNDGVNVLLFRDVDATDGDRSQQYIRYVLVRLFPGRPPRVCGVFICPPQVDSPDRALMGVLNAEPT